MTIVKGVADSNVRAASDAGLMSMAVLTGDTRDAFAGYPGVSPVSTGTPMPVQLVAISAPTTLISTPQTLTDAYAAAGNEIDLRGCGYLGVYVSITKNNSSGIVLQLIPKLAAAAVDEYQILNNQWVFQLQDADQKSFILIPTFGLVPVGQLQIKASDPGSPAATLDSLVVSKL